MATGMQTTGFRQGTKERLLNQFDEIGLGELLALEEPWTVRDCDRDQVEMAQDLNKLIALEVVTVVGEQPVRWEGQSQWETINTYRFDRRARDVLERYKQNRNELPCEHHAHIHHRADGRLGCRYCDEDVTFERSVVERAMRD